MLGHFPYNNRQTSYNDDTEAKSAENTLTKGSKIKRRFTFTRSKSPSKSGTRQNAEVAQSNSDFSSMLFRRRKASTPTPKAVTLLSKRDSSDDSSLNWSIPSDLPGVVEGRHDRGSMENIMFADPEEIRARCRSTPTIAERRESESTIAISEMRISQNGPMTAEVAVQVDSSEPIFQFPDILPESHYDLLNRSPPQSRSMPQSPYTSRAQNSRRMGVQRIVSWGKDTRENGDVTVHNELRVIPSTRGQRTAIQMTPSPRHQYARYNGHHLNSLDQVKKENVSNVNHICYNRSSNFTYRFQGGSITRAKSIDSISTELDDVCGKIDDIYSYVIIYDKIM